MLALLLLVKEKDVLWVSGAIFWWRGGMRVLLENYDRWWHGPAAALLDKEVWEVSAVSVVVPTLSHTASDPRES